MSYTDTAGSSAFNNATLYSYDIHGNVDTLLQDYGSQNFVANMMNKNNNRFKKIVYQYDLISGKVNHVAYQQGWGDQLLHRYAYDAENRLTLAESSLDGLRWEKEAQYAYYHHGPLARTELGQQQVQGIDYAYTIHGWLKGLNSTSLITQHDMGQDGYAGAPHQYTARDVIGLSLNYYDTADFSPINSSYVPFYGVMGFIPDSSYRPLFNGNISSMAVHNRRLRVGEFTGSPLMFYNYRYDQLNRLTFLESSKKTNLTFNFWAGLSLQQQFLERISYDDNGNILSYRRHGHKGNYLMDQMSYYYESNTNRLNYIWDPVPVNRYGTDPGDIPDIDGQNANNYLYDATGNLVRDVKENIASIKWSVYGKILEITRWPTTDAPIQKIRFSYDAQGNRIGKVVELNSGLKSYIWYVRDAQGNTLATYESSGSSSNLSDLDLSLTERYLYGSNRLGMYNESMDVDSGPVDMADSMAVKYHRGYRHYELSNHLGNVLATITDKKKGVDENSNGIVDYYDADVSSAQDYYPFGMVMPGRNWSSSTYRYGFNGKENDNEVKGTGNQQDYGMRIYDPRLGRFLSVDPLTNRFPFFTPYQFSGNTPIWATDLDGGEPNIALPRGLTFPEPILTLPKLPPVPVQPVPPIPPAIPGSFHMPQTPTLPSAPYMPLPPATPPIVRSTPIDESTIDPNDATTYPKPPSNLEGEWKVTPIKPGTRGYEKLKEREASRLENEQGDILRWHKSDKYHPEGHWDFKKGGNENNPWKNYTPDGIEIPKGSIYGNDFNPAVNPFSNETIMQQLKEYSEKQEYQKKLKQYDKDMKKYNENKKKYDKKIEQYYKDHPESIS